jgi:hypothetical protein
MRDALHLTKFTNFVETMPTPGLETGFWRPAGCQKQFEVP